MLLLQRQSIVTAAVGALLLSTRATSFRPLAFRMLSSSPSSSNPAKGKLILGSKSSTRRLIIEEMGFTAIIRYAHALL
jgi:hypothetical protein